MDLPPFKTFIAYFIIWCAWLFTHDTLTKRRDIDYALKLDDILYKNSTETDFPFGPSEFSEFIMV